MGLMKNFTWKWLNTALKAVASFSFNLSRCRFHKCLKQGVCGTFYLLLKFLFDDVFDLSNALSNTLQLRCFI